MVSRESTDRILKLARERAMSGRTAATELATLLTAYPLYRWHDFTEPVGSIMNHLPTPPINVMCGHCGSEQTFKMINSWSDHDGDRAAEAIGVVADAVYRCAACDEDRIHFFVYVGGPKRLMKIGQFPSWSIAGDKNIEKLLGEHAHYFRKGLVSESQGYGIGAFAYYRRIVEEIIDQLIEQIGEVAGDERKVEFANLAEKAKRTKRAVNKIEIVKDFLPSNLRPGGRNPLSTLHDALSEGLHAESDDRCLELAEAVRTTLIFLTSNISRVVAEAEQYAGQIDKLLGRKAPSDSS